MKKIVVILFIFLCIFNLKVYSKYKYEYVLECFDLIVKKDIESPSYDVSYSTTKWTNKDVVVKIKFSEEINGLDGFEYKDGFYIKTCKENEVKELTVQDFAGNKTNVKYQITNIDKSPPIITGIDNNKIYTSIQKANYTDTRSGIESVEKIYYGDLILESNQDFYSTNKKNGIDVSLNSITLNVIRSPKNIVKYKYYRIDSGKESFIESNKTKIIYKNSDNKNYKYYVIAIDNDGKMYKSNIIERKGAYFENIILNKNTDMADISILGLNNLITKVDCEILSLDNTKTKFLPEVNSNIKFYKNEFDDSNKYKIKLKFYSKNTVLDERYMYINFNEHFVEEDNNTFSKNGNYDIKIKDKAGNECFYTIIVNMK